MHPDFTIQMWFEGRKRAWERAQWNVLEHCKETLPSSSNGSMEKNCPDRKIIITIIRNISISYTLISKCRTLLFISFVFLFSAWIDLCLKHIIWKRPFSRQILTSHHFYAFLGFKCSRQTFAVLFLSTHSATCQDLSTVHIK